MEFNSLSTLNIFISGIICISAYIWSKRFNLPDEAFEEILQNQIRLRHDNEERDVGPGEQRELPHVVLFHERQHEPDKAGDVETEWYEPKNERNYVRKNAKIHVYIGSHFIYI